MVKGLIFTAHSTGTWGSRCTSVFSRQPPDQRYFGSGLRRPQGKSRPPYLCKVEMISRSFTARARPVVSVIALVQSVARTNDRWRNRALQRKDGEARPSRAQLAMVKRERAQVSLELHLRPARTQQAVWLGQWTRAV